MLYYILYIIVYSVFIPVTAASIRFKKHSATSRALFYFLLFSGTIDIIVLQFTLHNIDATPGLHFYTVGELLSLSYFFYQLFHTPLKKRVIVIVAIAFVILSAINTSFFQPLREDNSYTRSLEALIMIAYCFMYFDQESRIRQTIKWEKKPFNWFVTGLLVYFAGAFFFFLFSNVITKLSYSTQNILWGLHGVLQIIMYLLITVGFINERGK